MKVAIIADPLDNQRAGVHVYVRELVQALAANPGGHEYVLIREKKDPALALEQVEVGNIHLPVGYASLRLFAIIPRILRRLKVDAVFEPAHFGPFNLPAGVKRITMIHDLTPILFPEFHRWHSQTLQKIFLRGILQRADLVISNSRNTERDLHRIYPFTRSKVKTILLGRNEQFKPDTGTDFLEAYNITTPYFLYVGTIEPRKNIILLLTAYLMFREEARTPVQLIVVGQSGWKNDSFEQALAEHPYRQDIILTGYVSKQHLLQAYTHTTAMVYPSIYEGFGFPILEAMACGANVICPDNSSLPEVGGELAYYYATHDPAALCKQLLLVWRGGKTVEERAAQGPLRAATFSWADYAIAFNAALAALTKGKS